MPVAADDPTNCPAKLDHGTEWSTSELRADLKQRLIFLSGSVLRSCTRESFKNLLPNRLAPLNQKPFVASSEGCRAANYVLLVSRE